MTRTGVVFSAAALAAVCAAANAGPGEAMAFAIGQCSSQPDDKARLLCYDMIAAQLKSGQFASGAAAQPFVQLPPAPSSAQPPTIARAPAPPSAAAPAPMAQLPAYTPSAPAPQSAPPAPQSSSSWYDPTSWFGKNNPQRESDKPADFGAETIRNQQVAANDPAQPKALDEMRANVSKVEFSPTGRFIVTLENGQVWRQLDADTGQARFNKKGGDAVTISRGLLGSYNLVVEGRAMLFKVKRLK